MCVAGWGRRPQELAQGTTLLDIEVDDESLVMPGELFAGLVWAGEGVVRGPHQTVDNLPRERSSRRWCSVSRATSQESSGGSTDGEDVDGSHAFPPHATAQVRTPPSALALPIFARAIYQEPEW